MVQLINTIFIGLIAGMILKNKEKYKNRKTLRFTIIAVWSVLYFLAYAVFPHLIMIFGPAAMLVLFSYIYRVKKKDKGNR
ncbi:hypothetical protein [Paenibacillus daejeonensis]|uniref:hypothetical protein n=1 Tax=Paenibacillus daejeonensis TaxID=135193 RepID=UPI00035D5696|nr:hypothetical protein [Paenibacillus daejeonensis]